MNTHEQAEPGSTQDSALELSKEAKRLRELEREHSCFFFKTHGVFDDSGRLAQGFAPTVYELEVLAEHYAQRVIDQRRAWLSWGQTGSHERRFKHFAEMRLDTIAAVVGKERLNFVLRGPEAWDEVFSEGAEEICERRGVTCLGDLNPEGSTVDPDVQEVYTRADRAKEEALKRTS